MSCPRYFDGPANFDAVLGTDGQERFIEANARLGGNGVPRLLAAAYGVDVVRALMALALGESSARPHPAQRNQLALGLSIGVAQALRCTFSDLRGDRRRMSIFQIQRDWLALIAQTQEIQHE